MQAISTRITHKFSNQLMKKSLLPHIQYTKKSLQSKIDLKNQFDRDGYLVIKSALNIKELSDLRQWTQWMEDDAFQQKLQIDLEHKSNINHNHNHNHNHKMNGFTANGLNGVHHNNKNKKRGLHHFEVDHTTNNIRIARSEKLVDCHDGFHRMMYYGKLPELVSNVMGEPSVLYKEKINYKYPNCGQFKAHQDAPAYPEINRSISCAVAIDGADEVSGCLEFATGRHKEGVIGKNSEGIICDDIVENVELRKPLIYDRITTEPGDIVLFDAYLPHKSGINTTNNPRRMLYVTFNPLSEGDLRATYYKNKDQNLKEGKVSFIFDFDGNIVSTIGK